MKNMIRIISFSLIAILLYNCDKDSNLKPSDQTNCKLLLETTNLPGNYAEFMFTYEKDGTVSSIKRYIGGYNVMADSTAIGSYSTETFQGLDYPAGLNVITTIYKPSFDQLPELSHVTLSYPKQGITYVNYWTYIFLYDNKERLVKVSEHTENIDGDGEYDLHIAYNEQDNVTSLSYEITTGPRIVTTITATGYDDKPNPFSGIKFWRFIKPAAWNSYEPDMIFTALSKNNLLGYTMPDGYKREITYEYNDQGLPVKKIHANSSDTATSPGTYYYTETFSYECP
jgi:hypothetical protein